jgi:hypothetical protein
MKPITSGVIVGFLATIVPQTIRVIEPWKGATSYFAARMFFGAANGRAVTRIPPGDRRDIVKCGLRGGRSRSGLLFRCTTDVEEIVGDDIEPTPLLAAVSFSAQQNAVPECHAAAADDFGVGHLGTARAAEVAVHQVRHLDGDQSVADARLRAPHLNRGAGSGAVTRHRLDATVYG